MERWQDDAAAEFEDEFVVVDYMPRRKRRFVPKQVVEEEVEVSEDLTRLGFRNDNGKWSRTAPRTGARTVVIEGSREDARWRSRPPPRRICTPFLA